MKEFFVTEVNFVALVMFHLFVHLCLRMSELHAVGSVYLLPGRKV